MKSLMARLWRSPQRPPQHRGKAHSRDRLERHRAIHLLEVWSAAKALPFKGRVGWGWGCPTLQRHSPAGVRGISGRPKSSRLPPLLQKHGRVAAPSVSARHPRESGDPATFPRALREARGHGRPTKARGFRRSYKSTVDSLRSLFRFVIPAKAGTQRLSPGHCGKLVDMAAPQKLATEVAPTRPPDKRGGCPQWAQPAASDPRVLPVRPDDLLAPHEDDPPGNRQVRAERNRRGA